MKLCSWSTVLLSVAIVFCGSVQTVTMAADEGRPAVHHPDIAGLTLFAENPDIMTPVGIAVAPDGRVFVQENHTHKRDSSYEGPKTDRILVFEDVDGDGRADKRSVFYEGHVFSTDLLFGPDGHLYFSTRWLIGRFRNAATQAVAVGEPETLVTCETAGDYPHNGVGGLAIDRANPDWLAFGFGENLGVGYRFVGSDGRSFSGGGEGGSTYRCRTDGSQLTKLSTGHWNAFGMTYDLKGNLFSTDNDPNSTPPNRLLNIIPGADFGYEYRYGRSGRHPLVTWFGELPGTLGMVGALGEAACGVTTFGEDQLLVASWTDNRIDRHPLTKQGTSFQSGREPFITGSDDFRPVHFSYSADGRYLYFTDWMKLSYPVHGHGRIWRVEFKHPVSLDPLPRTPTPEPSPQAALALLGSPDAYQRTRAIHVLTQQPDVLTSYDWKADTNPTARANAAVAFKRIDPKAHAEIIPTLLSDASEDVRVVGIKWIADERLSEFETLLEKQFDHPDIGRRTLPMVIAAIARLTGSAKGEFSADSTLLKIATDESKSAELRALALQSVQLDHQQLTIELLSTLASSRELPIRREAIRSLSLHSDRSRSAVLAELAVAPQLETQLRADAVAALAEFATEHAALLKELAGDKDAAIAREAFRTMVSAGLIMRKLRGKPPLDALGAWEQLIDDESGVADTAAGRRLFFHPKFAGCSRCHAMNGRGMDIGPDLTMIHRQNSVDRKWFLQHIVNPSREVAPYYRPQQIVTADGRVLTGFIVGREGQRQGYLGTDGNVFYVDKNDVEERREITTSIMPTGLLDNLAGDEIRDLIAFLMKGGE